MCRDIWRFLPGFDRILVYVYQYIQNNQGREAEVVAEFGIRYIPEIEKTGLGTPLLSSAFELVRKIN